MSGLGPMSRALVDASRHADDPTDADVVRVESQLMGKIAVGATATVGLSLASTKTATASALGAKLAASVVAVGLIAGGGYWLTLSEPEQPPSVETTHQEPTKATEPVVVEQVEAISSEAEAPEIPQETRVAQKKPTNAAAPPSSPALRLKAEAQLLGQAQRALGSGQASTALQKLGEYDQRFPRGALRAEAEATRVFALCQAGRTAQGRTAQQTFLRRFPSSPAAPRVRKACGGTGN